MDHRNAPSTREVLDSAANAIKRGDIALGKERLQWVLEKDPENVLAWLWMSRCVEGVDAKLKCFHRVLAIDPTNEHALNGIQSIRAPTRRPKVTSAAEKHGDPPSAAGPGQTTAKRRQAPLILFGVLASIALFICGFFIIGRFSDTSNGGAFAPKPSFSGMFLGQDGNRVREMLSGKGYSFKWSTDVGGWTHKPTSGVVFILYESDGRIDNVTMAADRLYGQDWERLTNQFVEDCNLPVPDGSNTMTIFLNKHRDDFDVIGGGSGRVMVYPAPGLKFTAVREFDSSTFTSYYILSYTLSD